MLLRVERDPGRPSCRGQRSSQDAGRAGRGGGGFESASRADDTISKGPYHARVRSRSPEPAGTGRRPHEAPPQAARHPRIVEQRGHVPSKGSRATGTAPATMEGGTCGRTTGAKARCTRPPRAKRLDFDLSSPWYVRGPPGRPAKVEPGRRGERHVRTPARRGDTPTPGRGPPRSRRSVPSIAAGRCRMPRPTRDAPARGRGSLLQSG